MRWNVAISVSTNSVEVESETAIPDNDLEARGGGRKTYRVPEGRPCWAQSVELILPVISPRSSGVEVAEDHAFLNSESADRSTAETNIAKSNPPIRKSSCAEVLVIRPGETNSAGPHVADDSQIRHSATADYETDYAERVIDYSAPRIVTDPPIHQSEAADYKAKGTFVVPYSNPPFHEFRSATTAKSIAVPRIAVDPPSDNVEYCPTTPRPRPYQGPPSTTEEDGLNEDPSTRYSYTYNIKAKTNTDSKQGHALTRGRQRTKSSIRRTTSGSVRDSSCDRGQITDGNRVGSTNGVNLKDFAINRKWSSENKGRKSDLAQTEVNRKFRTRRLMTSSVTTVLSPRPYSVHNVRSTASLGAQRTMTSSKPEPEMQRQLAVSQTRVR